MRFFADFHIHSKYSRATSKEMDLENLDKWARIKGIQLLGTGDFTHPGWLKELKSKLEPAEPGFFKLRKADQIKSDDDWYLPKKQKGESSVRYILTCEISCIYSKRNKTKKVHMMVLAPSFSIVDKINAHLGWIGNLKADGRPILGLDAKELLKIVLDVSSDCLVIPAHIWTPHFSVFGSESGFNSLEQCFDAYAKNIYAVETGLSSDPAMNWRIPELDNITLISNSDAHGPSRIGREANVFEGRISGYRQIAEALKMGKSAPFSLSNRLVETIEFFPEEGKYYLDGHGNCKVVLSPKESKRLKGKCPKCGKRMTLGVLNRVEELAERPEGFEPPKKIPFRRLASLEEIIAEAFGIGKASKKVENEYHDLINRFGSEFEILLETDIEKIGQAGNSQVAEAIKRVREGRLNIEPGYDGEYGKIRIFDDKEREILSSQKSLF